VKEIAVVKPIMLTVLQFQAVLVVVVLDHGVELETEAE
jgi:hypothetical protein